MTSIHEALIYNKHVLTQPIFRVVNPLLSIFDLNRSIQLMSINSTQIDTTRVSGMGEHVDESTRLESN